VPLITIRLTAGRSDADLAELVRAVSSAAARALDVPIERISLHLFELPPDRIARGGRLLLDPPSADGGERP
jgi:phenylpyruvate tautomerase PptA (4-oxalocrotonate tautomerase family)